MKSPSGGLIRLVAVVKLMKAITLIAVGVGLLELMHADVERQLEHWIRMLGLDPGARIFDHAIQRAASFPHSKFKLAGVGSFVYAALFLTEGVGLWLEKRWAEWFTVVITSSLVPLELYEIYRQPSAVKILVLAVNLAVVGYLLYRIKSESRGAKEWGAYEKNQGRRRASLDCVGEENSR